MKPTRNPVTGDFLITGAASDSYRDGWDRIFGKKKPEPTPAPEPVKERKPRKPRAKKEAK
jgi:hypothetical protein